MGTIHTKKRMEVLDTPLLLFDCALADGGVERWSTHAVTVDGQRYAPRLLSHSGFDLRLAGEDAIDSGWRFTLVLSNVDGRVSQLDRSVGWKGAKLTVRFGFFDVAAGVPVSELTAVFLGVANPVDELTETSARLSFTNRLSVQRLSVPSLRVQARCPWRFPSTEAERQGARDGGRYSAFWGCGYSAGLEGGTGNLDGGNAFTTCNRTREECAARGMLRQDAQNTATARFGGFAFIPPSISVRPNGEKNWVSVDALDGRARTNDAVPLVYGTAWIQAPVIFARSDGNLTHCEALVAAGPIEGIRKVLVNGVELPLGEVGKDMTATGWYNVLSLGERTGGANLSLLDAQGQPAGDPHGGMACLAVVAPNKLMQSNRLPKVEVLLDGMKLPRYDADGAAIAEAFTRNPAWVVLDLLRRSGWEEGEINLPSFAATALYCDEFIAVHQPDGTAIQGPRFEVNLALTQRRSLNETLRGLRLSASMMISVDESGRIQVMPEATLARQGAVKKECSNSSAALAGGWPAYEFGDGLNGFSAILRKSNGASSFRIWRRASSELPNRLSVEFQDAFNDYQQDSLSLVDYDDAARQGCEVAAPSGALGLPHFDQAARALRLQIQKNVRGNHYVEFETTVQAIGLRPGDLITVSHAREGLDRQPFRLLRLTPALNYERVKIVAQRHDDEWYELVAGDLESGQDRGRQPDGGLGTPRPLSGAVVDEDGRQDFAVAETGGSDSLLELTVRFTPPQKQILSALVAPVMNLQPTVHAGGGGLPGGRTYFYAVSCVDEAGTESPLSFLARVALPAGSYSVELTGLRSPAAATSLRVYRGTTSRRLARIADGAALGPIFVDDGLAGELAPPPDANYDHARFQWRFEMLPETVATVTGEQVIGNSSLGLLTDEYVGCAVRILKGRGEGQERIIASNSETVLTVSVPWTVLPDETSYFAIAEAGWKSAGVTTSDEINFLVPNQSHEFVQVMGLSANALGVESPMEEALVTRHELAGSGGGGDPAVPGEPSFGLSVTGGGMVEIGGIGFESLDNTRTIQAGTLRLQYWDELRSPTPLSLQASVQASDQQFHLNAPSGAEVGDMMQVGGELVRVLEVQPGGSSLLVDRGCYDSSASPYGVGMKVYLLLRHTVILPFPEGFFGSEASGSYAQRIWLPNARIAAAELFMTNARGDGPTGVAAYGALTSGGLRTMSGGQYSVQWDGVLAVVSSIAPPLVVDANCAVRSVQASVAAAPIAWPVVVRVMVNSEVYCELTLPPGAKNSNVVDGFGKPPLLEGSKLTVDIMSVGTMDGSDPGRDLTVTIRL
jgi:hypothetical protein